VEEAFHSLHLPGRIVDITRSIFVAERISFSFRGRKFFSSSSLAVAPPQRFIFNGERGAHNKNIPSPLPGRNMENLCSRRGETIFSINYIFSWHEQKEKGSKKSKSFSVQASGKPNGTLDGKRSLFCRLDWQFLPGWPGNVDDSGAR
jgi:hypothetical protein